MLPSRLNQPDSQAARLRARGPEHLIQEHNQQKYVDRLMTCQWNSRRRVGGAVSDVTTAKHAEHSGTAGITWLAHDNVGPSVTAKPLQPEGCRSCSQHTANAAVAGPRCALYSATAANCAPHARYKQILQSCCDPGTSSDADKPRHTPPNL